MSEPGPLPASGASSFRSERQQRIYRRLDRLAGPAPAAFYRDMCLLRNTEPSPQPLESVSHVVFHLLREIEGYLRKLLEKDDDDLPESHSAEQSGEGGHKQSILRVLAALDIPKDHAAATKWLDIHRQLYKYAHRSGLESVRPLTEEQLRLLSEMDDVFDYVLEQFQKCYVEYFRLLEELARKPTPTNDDIKTLREKVPQNYYARAHFYNQLSSPDWINKLFDEGFFEPTGSFQRGSSESADPYMNWPQADYLERMVQHRPELVADVYSEILPRACDSILNAAVEAALKMSPNVAARVLKRICEP